MKSLSPSTTTTTANNSSSSYQPTKQTNKMADLSEMRKQAIMEGRHPREVGIHDAEVQQSDAFYQQMQSASTNEERMAIWAREREQLIKELSEQKSTAEKLSMDNQQTLEELAQYRAEKQKQAEQEAAERLSQFGGFWEQYKAVNPNSKLSEEAFKALWMDKNAREFTDDYSHTVKTAHTITSQLEELKQAKAQIEQERAELLNSNAKLTDQSKQYLNRMKALEDGLKIVGTRPGAAAAPAPGGVPMNTGGYFENTSAMNGGMPTGTALVQNSKRKLNDGYTSDVEEPSSSPYSVFSNAQVTFKNRKPEELGFTPNIIHAFTALKRAKFDVEETETTSAPTKAGSYNGLDVNELKKLANSYK